MDTHETALAEDDLVERLMKAASNTTLKIDQAVMREAATALTALNAKLAVIEPAADSFHKRMVAAEARVAELLEALEPFAKYMQDGGDLDHKGNPLPDDQGVGWVYLTIGDFRRARAAHKLLRNHVDAVAD